MNNKINKNHMKEDFAKIKPICDMVMINPTTDSILTFSSAVCELKKENLQEMQQYMLFPIITHLQSKEIEGRYEFQRLLVNAMKEVLSRTMIFSYDMCIRIEMNLAKMAFDKNKPGMIAEIPEELKLAVMQCLVALMLNLETSLRLKVIESHSPLLAQAVFVSVHMAKLEKLRALKLTALESLMAHTCTHEKLTDSNYMISDPALEKAVVHMLCCILPGVLATLQDVAMCSNNPGQAVVTMALNATHRIVCMAMNDKHLKGKDSVTVADFLKAIEQKDKEQYVSKAKSCDLPKLSVEWYNMAGEKLEAVIRSLIRLVTHEHFNVRKELAVLCYRIVSECNNTMQPSIAMCLDILISLSSDPYPSVAEYCLAVRGAYFRSASPERALSAMDGLAKNLNMVLASLPRVLNNIDSARKMSTLSLLQGYVAVLCDARRPQRLGTLLAADAGLARLALALAAAAALRHDLALLHPHAARGTHDLALLHPHAARGTHDLALLHPHAARGTHDLALLHPHAARGTHDLALLHPHAARGTHDLALLHPHAARGTHDLALLHPHAARGTHDLALLHPHAARDITVDPPLNSPWCKFRHLDSPDCEKRFRDVLVSLGEADCAQLILDTLLEMFRERRTAELVYLMNWIAVGPKSTPCLAQRLIDVYIEEEVWSLPLEVGTNETPLTEEDTLDVDVYNPRAWVKDSVPGLFEGATEVRYTDISYQTPRVKESNPNACKTLREAEHNMALCCLLTEGVGMMARRLQGDFQPYLLKTLCLVLERVGSRYEVLHLAGVKAINDIKSAGSHSTVGELIARNADYFTHQLTRRLKKAWNTQSALEILSVVMEYSDATILEYLYGIVEDVLVQSCDKYYQKNLYSYLQVFHTFVKCIHKWFPSQKTETESNTNVEIDVLKDVYEYIKNEKESERLMSESEKEDKSVEEMYKEDLQKKEDGVLDYDDTVTQETPPLPRHVEVAKTILKRCINFIPTKKRDDAILAIQVIHVGLPVLKDYEDELLPLVHLTWGPLVTKFEDTDTAVMRSALELLVTLAELSEDFIRQRTVKEVLPRIYSQLSRLSNESHLKDSGSVYRTSPSFKLQLTALEAMTPLATRLKLGYEELGDAMDAVRVYLSRKQPRPLQLLAVQFFKTMLSHDYGCVWLHLRRFCANSAISKPTAHTLCKLAPVVGTPHETSNKDYDKNIKAIFDMK
ncbi:TELO2-interacting protein 1 homolog isoform X1 [Colias croceus]|uniref:TELO2-interacting protein 1 homolog isoform X1 n=1 Tax=Colias crocea TaxID=72248 RepID=UPI001E27ED11|nr:TELO2-interacting protein 1 homolog isoform X1 [Colias croceus]